jgi:hypothetical protein
MTRYRLKRNGVQEWLDEDGFPTVDASAAASFESATAATIFLLTATEHLGLWSVELYRAVDVQAVA